MSYYGIDIYDYDYLQGGAAVAEQTALTATANVVVSVPRELPIKYLDLIQAAILSAKNVAGILMAQDWLLAVMS
jgi:hypothetical protein